MYVDQKNKFGTNSVGCHIYMIYNVGLTPTNVPSALSFLSMNTRNSSARQKRCALRPTVPPRRNKFRFGSASRGTLAASLSGNDTVATSTGPNASAPLISSAKSRPRVTTNTTWTNGEIITFLSEVSSQEEVGRISVKLEKKTTTQVRECYNVLAWARLLHGRLDAQHVESASKALGDSYKVTLYSQPRTSEEREIWNWRRTLRKAFFRRLSASHFEPKPLPEEEVDKMHKLFLRMKLTPVNTLYIQSTSILKELNRIKKRDDTFGMKAKELCNIWANN
ncbi:hypothetical protein B0H14DRAFT_714211 [Mycena olivaceomarginata]|nr:hypothetical protein B0H14DRAFT_714211 [Mycena olivaceomarginata]